MDVEYVLFEYMQLRIKVSSKKQMSLTDYATDVTKLGSKLTRESAGGVVVTTSACHAPRYRQL